MSKRGGSQASRIAPGTSSSGAGTGGGGKSSSLNNGRNSHFKVVGSDSKYGMLLWQSKLQDKFLQEQKEKRRESAARRKSDEDYQKALQQSRTSTTTTSMHRVGSGGEPRTISFYNSNSNSNANREMKDLNTTTTDENRGVERRIEITRESNNAQGKITSHNPSTPPTPTVVVTDADVDAQIAAVLIPKDQHYLLNQNATATGASDGVGKSNIDKRMQDSNNTYYYNNGRSANTSYANMTGGTTGLSNNYQRDRPPVLPKIVPMKLNSSASCDNLALAKNTTVQQPSFGNLAFFGLNGGGGSPRRSPSGRLLTNLQGHPDIRYHQKDTRGFDQTLRYMMDKERINQYKEDLDKQLEEKQKWRKQLGSPKQGSVGIIKIMSSHDQLDKRLLDDQSFYHRGETDSRRTSRNGVELAPLIRKYKSLPRLNLNSTDVTKPFLPSPRRADFSLSPEPEEIAKCLSNQLAEKQRMMHIQQENEKLAAERHFNTWDSFWGRPGCGAPMYARNSRIGASTPSLLASRVDLFKALHQPQIQQKRSK